MADSSLHVPSAASGAPRASAPVDAFRSDTDVSVHRHLAVRPPDDLAAEARTRTVSDAASSMRWCVVEADTSRTPGACAPRCLLFFSPTSVRRVWRYPADWEALSDTELLALSSRPV